MAFLLRKFIEALALPLGLAGLLVLAALLARRRWWAVLGVAILWVASAPVTALTLMKGLESAYPELTVAEALHTDAVVMLAGGILRGVSKSGLQWGECSTRFFTAVELMLTGKARILILTDGPGPGERQSSYGGVLRAEAIRRGVPEDGIILIGPVGTTQDEAREVAALPGIGDILLVTSAFHEARAIMLFSAFGLHVTPFPTDLRNFPQRRLNGMDFVPLADGVRATDVALREYYGMAVYKTLLTFRPRMFSSSVPAAGSALR